MAGVLGVPAKDLIYYIYKKNIIDQYEVFDIGKKQGGTRSIKSPNSGLKYIQRKLLPHLTGLRKLHPCVTGFVEGRDIIHNARIHVKRKIVLNLDLENFFGSINFGRVYGMLLKPPYSLVQPVAACIAKICTVDDQLPQGAPTSPIISNLICAKMDSELLRIAQNSRCRYSRYADDITFSTMRDNIRPLAYLDESIDEETAVVKIGFRLGDLIRNKIKINGFKVNEAKFRVATTKNRQEVTGIIVNEFPNVKRRFIRQIRAMLYAWDKHGYAAALREYNNKYNLDDMHHDLEAVIRGKLSFVRHVKGAKSSAYIALVNKFNALTSGKEINLELTPKEIACQATWIIENHEDSDKINQGTAFLLEGVGFVTCAHCLGKNLIIYHPSRPSVKINITVKNEDKDRDLAILNIPAELEDVLEPIPVCETSSDGESIHVLGYPNYGVGQPILEQPGTLLRSFPRSAIMMMEVSSKIIEGNSGGPILNSNYQTISVVSRGINKKTEIEHAEYLGVHVSELKALMS